MVSACVIYASVVSAKVQSEKKLCVASASVEPAVPDFFSVTYSHTHTFFLCVYKKEIIDRQHNFFFIVSIYLFF